MVSDLFKSQTIQWQHGPRAVRVLGQAVRHDAEGAVQVGECLDRERDTSLASRRHSQSQSASATRYAINTVSKA